MVRSNKICFTLNNYEDEEQAGILDFLVKNERWVKFAIVGEEQGSEGTIHLQGYINLKTAFLKAINGNLKFWKKVPGLQRAHLEDARGDDLHNLEYCSKGGVYRTWGEAVEESKGDQWVVLINGLLNLEWGWEEVFSKYPELGVRYRFQIQDIINQRGMAVTSVQLELREWQTDVVGRLERQGNRKILFVIDEEGNKGKSTLARHLVQNCEAWSCNGGKMTDLMTAYNIKAKIAIFDMARCNDFSFWPWNFMESLKNGMYTTTKYRGCNKLFNPPSVVVFCNEDVPRDKFSNDRYDILKSSSSNWVTRIFRL